MKKLLFVIFISVILLSSCDWLFEDEKGSETTKKFWAQDLAKDYGDSRRYYQLTADLLAENQYCKVWAETTSGVSGETAKKMADAYINIYTKMITVFGINFLLDGDTYNTIELADYIGDGDGKLCILLLDIKDGYEKGVNEAAVGGYFYSGDLFDQQYSNNRDMIYIDTNPGKPGEDESNTTLAHELQHLMNVTTSMAIRHDGSTAYAMDLWIDEGLSSAAEWVYSGKHPLSRYGWYYYNGDGRNAKGLIDKGNNFYVWGNRDQESQYAVLDDYATVYLFFQWLRLQNSKGAEIYRDIIGYRVGPGKEDIDNYLANSYLPVTKAAANIDAAYSGWGTLLKDWLATNYINDTSGRYGYKNDPELSKIGKHLLSTNKETVDLYPGEGVFSKINGSFSAPADSGNIKYLNLTSALLTYNVNTANFDGSSGSFPSPETGTVTGVVSGSVVVPVEGRFLTTPGLAGPYWIGAGDVRRSGGAGNLSPAGVPRLLNSAAVSE